MPGEDAGGPSGGFIDAYYWAPGPIECAAQGFIMKGLTALHNVSFTGPHGPVKQVTIKGYSKVWAL